MTLLNGLTVYKYQLLVANKKSFITWAQSPQAACRIVADFEGVPLAWVTALQVEG
ncbi:hypothetical protein [Brevundimonas nasdae]|uniref:hypothetical protein n=1 Tax=Brevundimonas nasdae TaxID=172043 RepID=UPI003F690308